MKKILIAIDCYSGNSDVALDYAVQLAKNEKNLYVGVYVQDFVYENVHTTESEIIGGDTLGVFSKAHHAVDYEVIKDVADSTYKDRFIEKCQQHELNYKLHSENGLLLSELLRESEFADLLVIGYNSLNQGGDAKKAESIHFLLSNAMCPVLVVPEVTERTNDIILAYDNSTDAVRALREFAMLFPELCRETRTSLVSVMRSDDDHIRDADLLTEYAKTHYPQLSVHELRGEVAEQLFKFSATKNYPVVVMAGFGRNFLSRLFWPSVGEEIINLEAFPVFIAHK